jgi:hypothetical protein
MSNNSININRILDKLTEEETSQIQNSYSKYFYNILEHFIRAIKYNEDKKDLFRDTYDYCDIESDSKECRKDFVKTYRLINRIAKKLNAEELQCLEGYLIKNSNSVYFLIKES